ncbi:alpha/beta fold hydrolase [Spectribacter hydrogenooxidans]|uniref:Alpha/beta fold hydrolase n=1 Tax=Spectribacter hydrogenoxidans TaxID=3075608 RepID=A0ABU3BXD6_9GAMM|nr:alpha/beta fold hydrolase [Salinisphaera sp. W335]MDT0633905.1 alpha/beta fold hydrolase [Salinisphaera sp. W335]
MATGSNTTGNGKTQRVPTRDGGWLAVDVRGPETAATVVLVHGYPDSRRVWRHIAANLMPRMRVVTFDVRGAGDSFRPTRDSDYRLDRLAADLVDVIDHVSPGRPVHLVGHDWGAIQAWEVATDPAMADRLSSFTSVSGPCLDHIGDWLRRQGLQPRAIGQLLKSWYVGAFHLPLLPGLAWRAGMGRVWPHLLARSEGIRPDSDPNQTANGVHGTALYRANVLPRLRHPRQRLAQVPVQLIIPTTDPFVSPAMAASATPWCERLRRVEINAGHWLPLSQPMWLARQIHEFSAQCEAGGVPARAARIDHCRSAA